MDQGSHSDYGADCPRVSFEPVSNAPSEISLTIQSLEKTALHYWPPLKLYCLSSSPLSKLIPPPSVIPPIKIYVSDPSTGLKRSNAKNNRDVVASSLARH